MNMKRKIQHTTGLLNLSHMNLPVGYGWEPAVHCCTEIIGCCGCKDIHPRVDVFELGPLAVNRFAIDGHRDVPQSSTEFWILLKSKYPPVMKQMQLQIVVKRRTIQRQVLNDMSYLLIWTVRILWCWNAIHMNGKWCNPYSMQSNWVIVMGLLHGELGMMRFVLWLLSQESIVGALNLKTLWTGPQNLLTFQTTSLKNITSLQKSFGSFDSSNHNELLKYWNMALSPICPRTIVCFKNKVTFGKLSEQSDVNITNICFACHFCRQIIEWNVFLHMKNVWLFPFLTVWQVRKIKTVVALFAGERFSSHPAEQTHSPLFF